MKIHGQPEATDLLAVQTFLKQHQAQIKTQLRPSFNQLLADMETYYQPIDINTLQPFIEKVTWNSDIRKSLVQFITDFDKQVPSPTRTMAIAEKMWDCLLYTSPSPRDRTRSRMPSSA